MNSVKRILILALILGTMCQLMGCSSAAKEADENTIGKKTVITIWTKARHDAAYQEARIKEYNETNEENILVDYRIFSDNYAQALDSAFQTNSAPDMITYTDEIFNRFYAKGYFADIRPFMDEDFLNCYESVLIENVNIFDGTCYFIPTCATTPRLFYNKTLFQRAGIENPPATMEEMIEDAKKITELYAEEGIYGFAINLNSAKSALDRSLFEQANKEIGIKQGYDFQTGCYDFLEYEEILENWRVLLSDECAYPECSRLDIDPLRQMFADGKIGMYISYVHSEAGVYQQQFLMEDEWGCAQIPTTGGNAAGAQNYSLNNGILFNENSENLEAAWKVYCELFGDIEYQEEYYERGFGISVIPQVLETAKENGYEPKHETLQLGENDQIWPKTPHEANPEAVVVEGADLYETFKSLLYNSDDMSKALRDLTEKYNEAYQQGILNGVGEEIIIPDFDPEKPEITVEEKYDPQISK